MHRARAQRRAVGAEHRARDDRLRRRNRRVAVAHHRPRDEPALDDDLGLDAEKRRLPQHQIGHLADGDRADVVRDAVRDRRIDRVLGDVASNPEVVVAGGVSGQRAALPLHLVGRLPRPADHLADASHRLRVRRHDADGAEIVQHVLGGDRLGSDARIGERDVFRHARRQVMADHQHVEVLVERIPRERHRRVGRRGQHVGLAAQPDDVRRVAAAGAFGVVGVNRPAADRGNRVVDEAGFVERVGVNRHLHVEFVGHRRDSDRSPTASCPSPRAASGRARRRESARAARPRRTRCPCRESRNSTGNASTDSYMRRMFHAPGVHVVAFVPVAGPVPPPISVVMPE